MVWALKHFLFQEILGHISFYFPTVCVNDLVKRDGRVLQETGNCKTSVDHQILRVVDTIDVV